MKLFVIILGKLLAWMPQCVAAGLAWVIGTGTYALFSKRRRMMLRNLRHSFPEKSDRWCRQMAKTSCCRMAEMALFILVSAHLSRDRIRKMFEIDESFLAFADERLKEPRPDIFLFPHFSLIESLILYPAYYDMPEGADDQEIGVIYRPLNNKSLEDWVKKTRGRFGAKLLSRKRGFTEAIGILERNGIVGILFDQNAGTPGTMSLLFDRVASTTDLPDLLARKSGAEVSVFYTERTGFWKAKAKVKRLPKPSSEHSVLVEANSWLEETLRKNDEYCANWLWFHNRWRTQDHYSKRFRLEAKRSAMDAVKQHYGYHEMPRKTQFWIRMPNWLGDVVMALPLIEALRRSRPDVAFTLLAQGAYSDFIKKLDIAEDIISLPPKGAGYFGQFLKYRNRFPDTQYMFTNSLRGDLEARIIGAPQRFGVLRESKSRPFLTHTWRVPGDVNEAEVHQTHLWDQAFRHFGLEGELSYKPMVNGFARLEGGSKRIGMICGTENSPEKRWPVERWRELIRRILASHPGVAIELYGTARDFEITNAVSEGFDIEQVTNLSGKTSLVEFGERLRGCEVVICNDTGGMHLANMLGTSVIGIFGPTNPVRTGPIFEGEKVIMQPKGCSRTGGGDISEISASQVYERSLEFLK